MTPVYKLSASSITGRTNYGSMLAGNNLATITGGDEVVTTGGYVYRSFITTGDLSITGGSQTIEVMGCGGGGAGGGNDYGAGGGAGELDLFTTVTSATGTYNVTIGARGAGISGTGASGGTTTFSKSGVDTILALGGGGGGNNDSPGTGANGGSGGGAANNNAAGTASGSNTNAGSNSDAATNHGGGNVRTSISGDWARPPTSEARVNTARPASNIRRRPKTSPSRPPRGGAHRRRGCSR